MAHGGWQKLDNEMITVSVPPGEGQGQKSRGGTRNLAGIGHGRAGEDRGLRRRRSQSRTDDAPGPSVLENFGGGFGRLAASFFDHVEIVRTLCVSACPLPDTAYEGVPSFIVGGRARRMASTGAVRRASIWCGGENVTGEPQWRAGAHPSGGAPRPGSADVAEQRGARRRRALIAIVVLCLCMLAAGISAIMLFSPGGRANRPVAGAAATPQATTSPNPQARTSAPSSHGSTGRRVPATPKAAVAGHGLAKSALRYPKRLRQQILRWEAGPGGKALAAVTAQMGDAMQAAGTKLYPAMKLTCTQLVSDLKTARAGPAIPDAAMQRSYGRALAGLSRAAANCQQAISVTGDGEDTAIHVHNTLLNLSRAEFAAGSKMLYNATADIHMP